jgi:DNA-damage-inducible protein J
MNSQTQVRINPVIKKQASELFEALGLDMSSAINMFLHQCILRGGIPFSIEVPNYNKETIQAMIEAKKISSDPNVKGYSSIDELKKALDD